MTHNNFSFFKDLKPNALDDECLLCPSGINKRSIFSDLNKLTKSK